MWSSLFLVCEKGEALNGLTHPLYATSRALNGLTRPLYATPRVLNGLTRPLYATPRALNARKQPLYQPIYPLANHSPSFSISP
ncbi:hypothetical protein [Sporosarcina sp. P16b]|uniref:hypothetical protein n=1 Tax=Sporosarcina sp. P16b TaxID=2048261 RepID=UPI001303FF87|nr:hypothetical protein [Sporosarcina sp. P16b]